MPIQKPETKKYHTIYVPIKLLKAAQKKYGIRGLNQKLVETIKRLAK